MWLLLFYLVPAVQAQNRIALKGLDDPCQGRLEVHNAGEWGLVCSNGWNSENGQDEKNGEVVCRSLGCGKHAKSGHNKGRYKHPSQTKPKFWMDEVKCSGTEKNLWDCKKPSVTHCEADNYVVVECSAQNRIALRGPDGPCQGRLEVHNAGGWGLVCYHGWNSENGQDRKNGEVVCRSLGCGQHVESGHNKDSYSHPPLPTKFWMDEVKCSGTENNLWDCKKPRVTHCETDNYVTVKCSGSIELSLNRNGKMDECAGVVQFNTTNGYVSVCDDEWNKAKADMVCKELKCGTHHKIPQSGTFQRVGEQISLTVPLRCTGNEDFSWQCVDWVQAKSSKCSQEASVICSSKITG
ncbi:scavenger receptor cysteine-rich type 1 protein M160-like [Colossoma macropomum]|uniref:scavenger receptor cysteine-rich type 1 protein M160-like n=1 Tax=Colossoma macropomum TaxID=42526 RepID=UPI001864675A|nr:scavenger receptor cysteine-rich type 1 protein M160-like [Colossoma macropomum]